MKKLFAVGCVCSLTLFLTTSFAMAGAIDNKTNWSVEYIRTFNRNAATDYADAAAYNPAGTTKLEDGLYLNASLQYLAKDYSNTYLGTEYSQDEPSLIPGVFAVYTRDRWAGYFAFTNTGGGGAIDYKNGTKTAIQQATMISNLLPGIPPAPPGSWSITSTRAKGESYYLSYTFGGAYEINDMFSVSLGVRYVDAYREQKVSATFSNPFLGPLGSAAVDVEYEENANGWGGIIGLNITPNDKWNIGLRYETLTDLNFKTDVIIDDTHTVVDGSKRSRDLPAIIAAGVSYRFFKNFRTEVNLTYYLNEGADWEGAQDGVDNGYDLGIAFEYTLNPQWKFSLGYMFTYLGVEADNINAEVPELDANTVGGGFAYAPTPDWALNFGIGNTFYNEESSPTDATAYKKNVFFVAFGAQYKFF